MKINVFTKNIIIEPKICKDNKDKFKIILRYPNQFDATKILLDDTFCGRIETVCDLFIKFENKPILIDENKKEIEYENLKDMLNLGGSEILSIITDVVQSVTKKVQEAKKVEKKL